MLRFFRSLILGLLIGVTVGLYFGWLQFPLETRNRRLSDLAQPYRDEYSVMVAAGYAAEGDMAAAGARLSRLNSDNAPAALRDATERIILNASRGLADIRLLVQLADNLGQLSEIMQPFLDMTRDRT